MACLLLASVWCLLLLGGALTPWLGAEPARLAGFAACAALLLGTRPQASRRRAPRGAALLAGVAGWLALPGWLALVFACGSALGLAPAEPRAPVARAMSPWLANVALAPLFEELLYRERVLPALRRQSG